MNALAGILGPLQEALSELRVHKARVFLSLLGVLIAVAAITLVTGFGNLNRQVVQEYYDRVGGPLESYSMQYTPAGITDGEETRDRFETAFSRAVERYGIDYTSREISSKMRVQLPGGVQGVDLTGVDPQYGDMRRVRLAEGSWFRPGDGELLAPALIVSDSLWEALGKPDLRTHPTLEVLEPSPTTGVIVGVLPPVPSFVLDGEAPPHTAYILADALRRIEGDTTPSSGAQDEAAGSSGVPGAASPGTTGYVMWLPPEGGQELAERLQSDMKSVMGDEAKVKVERTDLYRSGDDPTASLQILINIVSSIVLAIGVVGYINLSIVTVRQRIREIGIRRSFGATSGRVFFSVMLESVAGTTIAGVIGIGLALLVLQNPNVQQGITYGILPNEQVPFPVEAALAGLIVSVSVGVFAGLIPAFIATRVPVIEAIRSN